MAKKGKYEDVVEGLIRLPAPPYQDRVDRAKAACPRCGIVDPPTTICIDKTTGEEFEGHLLPLASLTPIELAKAFVGLRRAKDALEDDEKALNLRIEAATQLLLASQDRGDEAWGQYGVKDNALRLDTGATIRVKSEPYGQVKDKELFRAWCCANGYEQQLQLWPSTMNAIAKERRANGEPDPDGVEVFRKDSIVFVAAGKDE